MPKCHKLYPNCQWTVTHCWPNLALDTVLLTEIYWSYTTHIVRVCFTPPLKPTPKRDLKCKKMFKLTFNLLPWQAFMNFCVIILLNTSLQLRTNFLLLFIPRYPSFILAQQFQPFYPKQQLVNSTSFRFYNVFLLQILECAIPIQLNISHAEG